MKNFKLKITLILWICFGFLLVYSQSKIQYTEQYKKLVELRHSKVEYEKFRYFKEQSISKDKRQEYATLELEARDKYLKNCKQIKSNPKKYLTSINNFLKNNEKELRKAGGFYQYVNTTLPYDPQVRINLYDFFKIVRYSFFENDLNELPPLEKIPILDKKEWENNTSYEKLINIIPEIKMKDKQ